jgi:hypothetical protein
MQRRTLLRTSGGLLLWAAVPIGVPHGLAWGSERMSAHVEEDEFALQPTARHLRALRRLRIVWNWSIESGGPIVDWQMPYGSKDFDHDLRDLAGTQDKKAMDAFHLKVARAFFWALEHGELPEGRYTVAPWTNQSLHDYARDDFRGLPEDRVAALMAELPQLSPDGTFTITRAHRLLIKAIRFDWPAAPDVARDEDVLLVPLVHFKRPFGDMTAFEIDMAHIIGEEPPASDPHYNRLYLEMWPALQAFVQHAEIAVRPDEA